MVIDPIHDEQGRLVGFAKVTRDLTERKAAQEALRASEERFRLLVEAVTDYAIYMLDPKGPWRVGTVALSGSRATPKRRSSGEHFSRFYTDEDRQTGLPTRALETAAREGRFEQEGWRVRKDGTRMWAHVVIDPVHDPSGGLIGFAKITRDISEKKAAQEELRRSEERFRLLVQGVTDYAIYMLDPEGRVSNWNPGAQRFKGYTEEEIIGEHFSRFYTDEDRQTGLTRARLRQQPARGASSKKAGASARTAAAFGHMSSSIRSEMRPDI